MDCDNARKTTITEAKAVPEGYDFGPLRHVLVGGTDPRGLPPDIVSLATFLYEDEAKTGPRIEIPATFTDDQ